MKKVIFILLSISSTILIINGQDIKKGSCFNKNSNVTDSIYYLMSNNSSQNIFKSKYVIFANKNYLDTLYIIDFDLDLNTNSLKISKSEKPFFSNFDSVIEFIPLLVPIKHSNYYCVKNYRYFDTTINLSNNNSNIFFTIADTIEPKIFLHQIETVKGIYSYSLVKFRKSYLNPHLEHSREYWNWYITDSLRHLNDEIKILELQSAISKEKRKIREEQDSIVLLLDEEKSLLIYKDTVAGKKLQDNFVKKMDRIFTDYLEKPQPFNYAVKGSYKLFTDGRRPKKDLQKLCPDYSLTSWFNQKIFEIDTAIKNISLISEKVNLSINNPYLLIKNNSTDRYLRQKNGLIDPDSIYMFEINQFLFDTIKPALEEYNNMFPLTTIYNYNFTYNSLSKYEKWILKDSILTTGSDTISNNIHYSFFYSSYPKAKDGRYKVRVNSSVLNQYSFGPEIDSVNRRYKFMIHCGINVGTFYGKFESAEGGGIFDNRVYYWNLFFIYHHLGLFGGFAPDQGFLAEINLKNYLEYGFYISPGNTFYFKCGLAKNTTGTKVEKNIYSAIVGASLIFPVFQIEGGYNFLFQYPYIMAGFNIPVNK
jgi:hypothetical protein